MVLNIDLLHSIVLIDMHYIMLYAHNGLYDA